MGNMPEVVLLTIVPDTLTRSTLKSPMDELHGCYTFSLFDTTYVLFGANADIREGLSEPFVALSLSALSSAGWEFS